MMTLRLFHLIYILVLSTEIYHQYNNNGTLFYVGGTSNDTVINSSHLGLFYFDDIGMSSISSAGSTLGTKLKYHQYNNHGFDFYYGGTEADTAMKGNTSGIFYQDDRSYSWTHRSGSSIALKEQLPSI